MSLELIVRGVLTRRKVDPEDLHASGSVMDR